MEINRLDRTPYSEKNNALMTVVENYEQFGFLDYLDAITNATHK
jgi:hypothetical protein